MNAEKWLNEHCDPKDWSEAANQANDFIHTSDVIRYMEKYASIEQFRVVIYKDGSLKFCVGAHCDLQAAEYQNDSDWLTTIRSEDILTAIA